MWIPGNEERYFNPGENRATGAALAAAFLTAEADIDNHPGIARDTRLPAAPSMLTVKPKVAKRDNAVVQSIVYTAVELRRKEIAERQARRDARKSGGE